jgi:putative acetyltransferase
MPVALRDVARADHEALLDVWEAAWSAAMPAIDFASRRPWFRERPALWQRRNFILRCATEGTTGELIGFVAISAALGYLDQIAVRPDRWGRGVGKALIAEAKAVSPVGFVLDVNQQNRRAIAFYERHGFRRLRADRDPVWGLPTWWYGWGGSEPPTG